MRATSSCDGGAAKGAVAGGKTREERERAALFGPRTEAGRAAAASRTRPPANEGTEALPRRTQSSALPSNAFGEYDEDGFGVADDSSPWSTRDDQVQALRRRATAAAQEGAQSTQRTLRLAREARGVGVDITVKLDSQGEQLERIQNDIDETHGHLTHSDEIIQDMQSFWKKLWPWSSDRNRRHTKYAPKFQDVPERPTGQQREIEALQKRRAQGTLDVTHKLDRPAADGEGAANGQPETTTTTTTTTTGTGTHESLSGTIEEAVRTAPKRERGKGRVLRAVDHVTRKVTGVEDEQQRAERERNELLAQRSDGREPLPRWRSRAGEDSESTQLQQQQDVVEQEAEPWEAHVQAQDRDLDEISTVVSDLRTLATGINEQLKAQNVQIDNVSKDVEYGRDRIHENNRRIRRLF